MKPTIIYSVLLVCLFLIAGAAAAQRPAPDRIPADEGMITVQPLHHGTLALQWESMTLYIDPYGGAEAFEGLEQPDLILITDVHGDHLNLETLNALDLSEALLVVPPAVAEQLPESWAGRTVVIANGERSELKGVGIRAVPMYNLPETEDSRHPKGRGNGYVLTLGGKQVYISGDTEGIPEMRSLKGIDIAFVCMNLPYTMDVEQAADAVLDFKPAIVYPYHYRGQDTGRFKQLVNEGNAEIEVRLRDWYNGN